MKSFIVALLVIVNSACFGQLGISSSASYAASYSTPAPKASVPHLELAQRNAINAPSRGLTIFNTTTKCMERYNGSSWDVMVSATHFIGQNYGGGIIFYINPDGLHGLVAETKDQSSGTNWYEAREQVRNLANHSAGGKSFNDWRLPAKDELNLLYQQKELVGGFANNGYWSGTDHDNAGTAWYQDFYYGGQYNGEEYGSLNVRAVRAF